MQTPAPSQRLAAKRSVDETCGIAAPSQLPVWVLNVRTAPLSAAWSWRLSSFGRTWENQSPSSRLSTASTVVTGRKTLVSWTGPLPCFRMGQTGRPHRTRKWVAPWHGPRPNDAQTRDPTSSYWLSWATEQLHWKFWTCLALTGPHQNWKGLPEPLVHLAKLVCVSVWLPGQSCGWGQHPLQLSTVPCW